MSTPQDKDRDWKKKGLERKGIPYRPYDLQKEMREVEKLLNRDSYFKVLKKTNKKVEKNVLMPVWDQGTSAHSVPLIQLRYIISCNGGRPVVPSRQELFDLMYEKYRFSPRRYKNRDKDDFEKEKHAAYLKKYDPLRFRSLALACLHYNMDFGQYDEVVYPFTGLKHEKGSVPPRAAKESRKLFIERTVYGHREQRDFQERLLSALQTLPAVVGTVASPPSFHAFRGEGTYLGEPSSDEKRQRHSVLILAATVDRQGREVFLIKNTWGRKWGHKGYGFILRDLVLKFVAPAGMVGIHQVDGRGKEGDV